MALFASPFYVDPFFSLDRVLDRAFERALYNDLARIPHLLLTLTPPAAPLRQSARCSPSTECCSPSAQAYCCRPKQQLGKQSEAAPSAGAAPAATAHDSVGQPTRAVTSTKHSTSHNNTHSAIPEQQQLREVQPTPPPTARLVARATPVSLTAGLLRAVEHPDRYELSITAPGFTADDVTVEVLDGVLSVRAAQHSEAQAKDESGRVVRSERTVHRFTRRFALPADVADEDAITAQLDEGHLRITVPRIAPQPQAPQPRRIAVTGGAAAVTTTAAEGAPAAATTAAASMEQAAVTKAAEDAPVAAPNAAAPVKHAAASDADSVEETVADTAGTQL